MWILGNPMKIEGKEFSNERAIYISNHASPIDIFLIMWLTPTGTVCIAKKEVHSLSDLSLPSFLLTAHYWFKLYQNFDMYINSYNSRNLPTLRLVVLRPGDRLCELGSRFLIGTYTAHAIKFILPQKTKVEDCRRPLCSYVYSNTSFHKLSEQDELSFGRLNFTNGMFVLCRSYGIP